MRLGERLNGIQEVSGSIVVQWHHNRTSAKLPVAIWWRSLQAATSEK
jgi:hypothetical protein